MPFANAIWVRLIVVALSLVAPLGVAVAEPSVTPSSPSVEESPWSTELRVGLARVKHDGVLDFTSNQFSIGLQGGRRFRRTVVGASLTVLPPATSVYLTPPEATYYGGDYEASEQLASLYGQQRWDRFALQVSLGIAHEKIAGGYAIDHDRCPVEFINEDYDRRGVVGSLGAQVELWRERGPDWLALVLGLDASALRWDRGTHSTYSYGYAGGSGGMMAGQAHESAYLIALSIGLRLN